MNKSEFKNPIIWVILGLFIVVSIFIVSGIVNSNSSETESSISGTSSYDFDSEFKKAKQQASDENAPKPDSEYVGGDSSSPNTATSASIGQSQPLKSESGDMMDVKIDSVEKDMGDGDYYIPQNGYFAKVTFTVTNLGDKPFEVTSHQLDFYDGNNMKAELNSRDFYSETIQPGKSATGIAYFDIMNDTTDYEVYFANASWVGSY